MFSCDETLNLSNRMITSAEFTYCTQYWWKMTKHTYTHLSDIRNSFLKNSYLRFTYCIGLRKHNLTFVLNNLPQFCDCPVCSYPSPWKTRTRLFSVGNSSTRDDRTTHRARGISIYDIGHLGNIPHSALKVESIPTIFTLFTFCMY